MTNGIHPDGGKTPDKTKESTPQEKPPIKKQEGLDDKTVKVKNKR